MGGHTGDGEPSAGHRALVDLERAGKLRAIVTQNIDGLRWVDGHIRLPFARGHPNAPKG